MAHLKPIPQPKGLPFLGHIFAIDAAQFTESFLQLAKQLGEIYALTFVGTKMVIVNSQALAVECCDEKRFHKLVEKTVLDDIRVLTGDALFTAYHGEETWGIAHRILTPAFGPANILNMFDDMYDILSQLVLKWERFGPKHAIDPADDFTRLAFDTIAFCAMSHRLNSFYMDGTPPFVAAMGDFLLECGQRNIRPAIVQRFMTETNKKFKNDMQMMLDLSKEIVDERRANPTDKKDLLNAMLLGKDPQTGKGLTDKSIMEHMLTFLIAGHETTSGMLSFLMYRVLKTPEAYSKLRAEVDSVVGTERIKPEHLGRLPYIVACLRETLRLNSPIGGISVTSDKDEIIGGKYLIEKGTAISVQGSAIQLDPVVWGDDAEEFRPERMLDGKFEALPPKSWLPFGNGARACIGRGFAWQEAIMAIVTLFQKFDFRLVDPSYDLKVKQTLTIKPGDLRIYALPRKDTTFSLGLAPTLATSMKGAATRSSGAATAATQVSSSSATQPIYVLYGSNTGSCEMFAQRIANDAPSHGFRPMIGTLDSAANKLPTDGPVLIITASFEGEAPDNAVHFVKHIESLDGTNSPLAGVRYGVFGCGNHDWVHTYQRIPKLVDSLLEKHGAERLVGRGEADAGGDRFFESFDEWENQLWVALAKAYSVSASDNLDAGLNIQVSAPTQRASQLRQDDAKLGVVKENRLLTKPGAVDKHHIEIQLPEGMTYRAGDYLAILPSNPPATVKRVLARFKLTPEQEISVSSSTPTTLPTHRPVSVGDLFSGYVELLQPATRRNLETLLRQAPAGSKAHDALQQLLHAYVPEVLEKRFSVLSILEKQPDIDVSLSTFLGMLPSMRVRQYSISSSPLWDATRVTLTIGVLRDASLSDSDELFQGVASTYLANLQPGDHIQIAVRPSSAAFHLPAKPETPIVMFASGSGIAPMRGFLQERAAQKAAGRDVGKALLFYGCRSPDLDFLYADTDLKAWVAQGVVDLRPAFSRAPELSEGCRYVQDRVYHDRADGLVLFNENAKFYTCGASRMAQGVKDAIIRIMDEWEPGPGQKREKTPQEYWASIQNERFAADVFG